MDFESAPSLLLLVLAIEDKELLSFPEDKGFNGKILECIDKGLVNLGEGVRQSFYHQVEVKYKFPKTGICYRADLTPRPS